MQVPVVIKDQLLVWMERIRIKLFLFNWSSQHVSTVSISDSWNVLDATANRGRVQVDYLPGAD